MALLLSPDLDENELIVLDTDYENYLFFCLENTDAPGQNLVCQCLSTSLSRPGVPLRGGGLRTPGGGQVP